jgi:hypothetical protein
VASYEKVVSVTFEYPELLTLKPEDSTTSTEFDAEIELIEYP